MRSVALIDPFNEGHNPAYLLDLANALSSYGISYEIHNTPEISYSQYSEMSLYEQWRLFNSLIDRVNPCSVWVWPYVDPWISMLGVIRKRLSVYIMHYDSITAGKGFTRPLKVRALKNGTVVFTHAGGCEATLQKNHIPHARVPIPYGPRSTYTLAQARKALPIFNDVVGVCILFIGEIREGKGVVEFCDHWTRKRPTRRVDIHVVVAGKDSIGLSTESYPDILFDLRLLNDSEVDLYLSAADVIVLPYTDSPGLSGWLALSAMHRTPVVAFDVGELGKEVALNELGKVVPLENWAQLFDTVLDVAERKRDFSNALDVYANACTWARSPIIHKIAELTSLVR